MKNPAYRVQDLASNYRLEPAAALELAGAQAAELLDNHFPQPGPPPTAFRPVCLPALQLPTLLRALGRAALTTTSA